MKVRVSKHLRETLAKLGVLPNACSSKDWEELDSILTKVLKSNAPWLDQALVQAISIACAEIEKIIETLVLEEYENEVKKYWAKA